MFSYLRSGFKDLKAVKITYFGRKITAERFLSDIIRTAGYIQNEIKGGSVGIALPNIPEAPIAFYAANAAGFSANLIHPRIGSEGLKETIKNTDTRLIFIYGELYKKCEKELSGTGVKIVVCNPSGYMRKLFGFFASFAESPTRATKFSHILKNEYVFEERKKDETSAAAYIHSGGTAGKPKTVVLSDFAINNLAESVIKGVYGEREVEKEAVMLMALPLFHGFGLGVCAHTVIPRAAVVLMPKFKARAAAKLIKRYKITHLAGVPAMYRKLLSDKAFGGDLSFIKEVFCGGDRLPLKLKEEFDDFLEKHGSKASISEGYGLTETTTVFSLNRDGAPGSQGKPLPGNEAEIKGSSGQILPYGEAGELYVKTAASMSGYLNDPEGTAEVMKDGWIKTGDIASTDPEGRVYFKDRAKRTLKIGAVNVFPAETEEAINSLPEVEESVVARITRNGKPAAKAFIVLKKDVCGSPKLAEKIRRAVAEKLTEYSVPREIEFVEKIV
jgi:Acyl-CoA synthetases (AMP-forming)/AMP-acid ligases II